MMKEVVTRKIKLIIFVRGTSGSVHVKIFNFNQKELEVIDSMRNAIRKGLVYIGTVECARHSSMLVFCAEKWRAG